MTGEISGAGPVAMEVFSRASTLRARTEGIFDAEVSAEWTIAGRPNGGYLLALLGRAASAVTGSGSVIAASAHYLRSPQPGAVEVEGRLLRRGRFISQVHTRMSQSGRSCVEALMSLGELDPSAACRWDGGIPEFRPVPFGECIRLGPDMPDGLRASIFGQVEARLAPESAGLRSRPSGRGEVCGWLKLPGGESFDPVSLLYAVDALPPPTLNTDVNAMVATVELTAHVRARPRPGPVWIASRARLIDHLCADTVCDIWDAGGRLVAHATQLAIMPPG